jgi:hypothetical protein
MIQKSLDAQPMEMSVMDDASEGREGYMRPSTPRAKGTPLEEAYKDEGV